MSALLGMLCEKKGGNEPYVESDGVAYTKLSNSSTALNIKYIKAKFQFVDTSGILGVFGYCFQATSALITSGVFSKSSLGDIYCYYGYNVYANVPVYKNNEKQIVEFDTTSLDSMYLTNNSLCFGYNYRSTPTGSITQRLSKVRIFYIELYGDIQAINLYRKYVPLIQNNEAGLYEEITGIFYPNVASSGQLTYGLG